MERSKDFDRLSQQTQTVDRILFLWRKYPSLRLGQLIENAMGRDHKCFYYVGDEEFITQLENYYDQLGP